jgi:hypothetical protein
VILPATVPAGLIAAAEPQAPLAEWQRTYLDRAAHSDYLTPAVRRRFLDVIAASDRRAHDLLVTPPAPVETVTISTDAARHLDAYCAALGTTRQAFVEGKVASLASVDALVDAVGARR